MLEMRLLHHHGCSTNPAHHEHEVPHATRHPAVTQLPAAQDAVHRTQGQDHTQVIPRSPVKHCKYKAIFQKSITNSASSSSNSRNTKKVSSQSTISTKTSITHYQEQCDKVDSALLMRTSSARKILPDTSYTNWNSQLFFCRIRRIQKSNDHTHKKLSWKK